MNPADPSVTTLDEPQYERRLAHDYFVRFHMSVILMAVTFSGVLTSKGLLELGVKSLHFRFPIAVLVSYGVFLGLVRIWIWYVSHRQTKQAAREQGGTGVGPATGFTLGLGNSRRKRRGAGSGSSFDLGGSSGGSSGGSGAGGGSGFSGFHGGSSGGGGASSSWDADVPVGAQPLIVPVQPSSSAGSSSGWFPKLDFNLDIDGDGWIILLLLAGLVLAIVGGGVYMIYAAPHILPEAAWQALLASTLTRVSQEEHHNWMVGVLRSTCLPFAVVLIFATALGWSAHHYCPAAPRMIDVIRQCVLGMGPA